jgi:hypothetical protein
MNPFDAMIRLQAERAGRRPWRRLVDVAVIFAIAIGGGYWLRHLQRESFHAGVGACIAAVEEFTQEPKTQ